MISCLYLYFLKHALLYLRISLSFKAHFVLVYTYMKEIMIRLSNELHYLQEYHII